MLKGFFKGVKGTAQGLFGQAEGGYAPRQVVQVGSHSVRVQRLLAEGGFAFVFHVVDERTQQPFAMKRMICQDRERLDVAKREVECMKKLPEHPNITKLVDHQVLENKLPGQGTGWDVLMLIEFCEGGHLVDIMNQRKMNRMSQNEVLRIFLDVLRGVAHMHGQRPPIAHRDIKVENVLLHRNRKYMVCDFGSATSEAKVYDSKREMAYIETIVEKYTTLPYRPPEMIDLYRRQLINEKVDIWALGCFLFKLAYYFGPFDEGGSLQILNCKYQIPINPAFDKRFEELIGFMLNPDPIQRPDVFAVAERVCKMLCCPCDIKRPSWYTASSGAAQQPQGMKSVPASPAKSLQPPRPHPSRSTSSPGNLPLAPAAAPAKRAHHASGSLDTTKGLFGMLNWTDSNASTTGSAAPAASSPAPSAQPAPAQQAAAPKGNALFDQLMWSGGNGQPATPQQQQQQQQQQPVVQPSHDPMGTDLFAMAPSPQPSTTQSMDPFAAVTTPSQPASQSSDPFGAFQESTPAQQTMIESPTPAASNLPKHTRTDSMASGVMSATKPSGSFRAKRAYRIAMRKATRSNPAQGPKAKHVRRLIVDSWERKDANDFYYTMTKRLHNRGTSPVVCFKSLVTLHKLLHQGAPTALEQGLKNSGVIDLIIEYSSRLKDASHGYPDIIRKYAQFMRSKLRFHRAYPQYEGNLSLDSWATQNGVKDLSSLPPQLAGLQSVQHILDLLGEIDSLQTAIFSQPGPHQAKMSAIVPLIREAYALYNTALHLLGICYSNRQVDTTSDIMRNFRDAFSSLRGFLNKSDCHVAVNSLMKVPTLESMPKFSPNSVINAKLPPSINPQVFKDAVKKGGKPSTVWISAEQRASDSDSDEDLSSPLSDTEDGSNASNNNGAAAFPPSSSDPFAAPAASNDPFAAPGTTMQSDPFAAPSQNDLFSTVPAAAPSPVPLTPQRAGAPAQSSQPADPFAVLTPGVGGNAAPQAAAPSNNDWMISPSPAQQQQQQQQQQQPFGNMDPFGIGNAPPQNGHQSPGSRASPQPSTGPNSGSGMSSLDPFAVVSPFPNPAVSKVQGQHHRSASTPNAPNSLAAPPQPSHRRVRSGGGPGIPTGHGEHRRSVSLTDYDGVHPADGGVANSTSSTIASSSNRAPPSADGSGFDAVFGGTGRSRSQTKQGLLD